MFYTHTVYERRLLPFQNEVTIHSHEVLEFTYCNLRYLYMVNLRSIELSISKSKLTLSAQYLDLLSFIFILDFQALIAP